MRRWTRVAVAATVLALVGPAGVVVAPAEAVRAPSKPTVTSASGKGWVGVKWSAASANGSRVLGYQVGHRRFIPSAARWTAYVVVTVNAAARSRTVAYANGTKAQFVVRSRNAAGYGAWSTATTTVAGLPAAVPGTKAAAGDRKATVSWSAAANNGTAITRYRVHQRSFGSGVWTGWSYRTVVASARSTVFTGLANGRIYQFQVRAINARGVGAPGAAVKIAPKAPPKAAPPTTAPPKAAPPTTAPPTTTSPSVSPEVSRLLADTNAFRAQNGKAPLTLMPALNSVAGDWAKHLHDTCTFEHRSGFTMYPSGWRSAGENIAAGYSYTSVVQGWIDSPGHRANLLGDYTHLGLGYYQGSNCYRTYFVQNFAKY